MFKTIKTAAIAGLVGLTALAAVPASAESLYLRFGDGGIGVYQGDNGRSYRRDRYREERREDYRDDYRRSERGCSPERALRKAERIGVRRARIADVSRRTISVIGRSRGERVRVTFARSPSCPIIG